MPTLKDQTLNAYIDQHYPNARIVNWDDPDSGLSFYTADQLAQVQEDWFPLCARLDPQTQKVVYGGRGRIVHTYTEGETGAGKTTRYAMQSIRALSCTRGKPSFLVVDIHGELVENLHDHLKRNGYAVRVLNCDDPSRSDTYNPFLSMARRCRDAGVIDNQTINELRKIAEIMQPIETAKDPLWDRGACSYTNGLILDKFEDLIQGMIPPEKITLYNIISNHYWLRAKLGTSNGVTDLMKIPHYQRKGPKALSVQKMITVTNTAERTMSSYMSVVEAHFDTFGQPTLYQLSSNSTIDIQEFIEQPTAIFIQSGNTRIGDDLLSLMTNDIYNTAVRMGKQSATKMLPRKIHCFLDEFANSSIAEGPEFIRMLTTSRKFGMYWHMLLQCDAQLERKFDQNMARIIRANCTEIFMGSHDYETTVRFAKSCGQRTIESLSSQVSRDGLSLSTVDLVTPDRLSLISEGSLYIKTNRCPLLYSYIEAFYKCPEFVAVEDIRSVYPVNEFDYRSTYFTPDDMIPVITDDAFFVLRYIFESPTNPSRENLAELLNMDEDDLAKHLQVLSELGYITESDILNVVQSRITTPDFRRLEEKHGHVVRRPILATLKNQEFQVLLFCWFHVTPTKEELLQAHPTAEARGVLRRLFYLGLIKQDNLASPIMVNLSDQELQSLCLKNPSLASQHIHDVQMQFIAQIADLPGFNVARLEKLTALPPVIAHHVRSALDQEELDLSRPVPMHRRLQLQLLTNFLVKNDFNSKHRWDQAMIREVRLARGMEVFPEFIIQEYVYTCEELLKPLSLEEILSLRKEWMA